MNIRYQPSFIQSLSTCCFILFPKYYKIHGPLLICFNVGTLKVHLLLFFKNKSQQFNNFLMFSIHGPYVSIQAGQSEPAPMIPYHFHLISLQFYSYTYLLPHQYSNYLEAKNKNMNSKLLGFKTDRSTIEPSHLLLLRVFLLMSLSLKYVCQAFALPRKCNKKNI